MDDAFNGFDSSIIKGPMPGEVLREARRSRDLSMQYIARELRLSVATIDALENDDYRNLPSSAFVQGYIRNYAALLGLEAEPLIAQYVVLREEQQAALAPKRRLVSPRKRAPRYGLPIRNLSYMFSLGLIVILLTFIYNSSKTRNQPAAATDKRVAAKTTAPRPERVDDFVFVGAFKNGAAAQKKPAPGGLMAAAGSRRLFGQSDLDTLSIEFNKSSFVVVTDANNKQLLRENGQRGYRAKVTGKAPFKVRLADPRNVVVILNGKVFKHLRKTSKGKWKRTIIVRKNRRKR